MKNTLLLVFALIVSMHVQSQQKKITGTVTENSGYPLPGVNIVIKKTTSGTQTDFDGKYEITAKLGDTLIFSYVGLKTVETTVETSNIINVVMEADMATLSEVVVTGQGIRRERKSLGYAVSEVISEEIFQHKEGDVARVLSGKASGVQISSANGTSGSGTNVVIRGYTSIKGGKGKALSEIKNQLISKLPNDISNNNSTKNITLIKSSDQPLFIVDGVPIHSQYNIVVKNMDKNDIEHVNVYKASKAKNIFGNLAKNGCIVITTKQGNYRLQNDESYAQIQENKFENVNLSPLSTFSIDVDKASYSNIRRMINNGQKVPFDAVKIEEMINYFDYKYDQPKDEHPFSIYAEVDRTPWNSDTKLVRIGLQGKTYSDNELPPSNLTFLIDVSGSMNQQNKLPLLKSAFKLLVNQLRNEDKVSIVVYAGAAGVVLEPTSGSDKDKILKALDNLKSGGSTAGGAGIKLAYKLAEQNFKKDGNNRVILATDGDFNVGASSDKDMKNLIEEKRETGVFLSVLGFGYGNYKDSKLETLADKGNGNHAYIDTMQEAQKVFGKEFGGTLYTIAKDVKIQVEFNPSIVKAYRLIGYENRLLNDEDFKNDKIDAGELGSGHTVTALYEVIPVGTNSDYLKQVDDLKYTDNTVVNDFNEELLTVKFRYKKPDGNNSIEIVHVLKNVMDIATEDFDFASAVALFGMQLRKSQYINGATIDDVLNLAKKGKGEDSSGYRAEFIRLVSTYK